jgi:predicted DsbA family dithiol-disulfide isomerase
MTDQKAADLTVDIVSDVVCPWCIVGYKQLEQALGQAGLTAQIRWHPFELNPQMAEEGEDLRAHLAAKYGTTAEDSVLARERLTALGTALGFTFDYADGMKMYNTFRAHQMLAWAAILGRQHDLKMELFSAFFTHRRNVNDPDVLADGAQAIGLDRNEALAVLSDGRFADQVREEEQFWTSRGIQGVPAMIFNEQHLVSGAQGVDNYASVLRQLTQGRAA